MTEIVKERSFKEGYESETPNVLVFLPTYNEEANIGKMIDSIINMNLNKEILVVDDNSSDKTIEIVNKKRNEHKNIKLIIRKGKKGRGLAGRTALNYFLKTNHNIFVELDADFSHRPEYIQEFLKFIPAYDVVIGSRLVKGGGEQNRTKSRFIMTYFANALIRILYNTPIKDCTSGFRAFRREIIENFNLNNFLSIHYSITEEILYACILCNAKFKEYPIMFYEREGGESKLNMKKIVNTFLGIIKIWLRRDAIIKRSN